MSARVSSLEIDLLPVMRDNYVALLRDRVSGLCAAVDPGVAAPVLDRLRTLGWKLDFILSTHHHADHTGGNLELVAATGCRVVGAGPDRERIPGITIALGDGDVFELGSQRARVIEVPGHTRGHIAFYFEASGDVFVGDTLFLMGCGRLFEGSAGEMHESLSKLAALPPATRVWCGHEYTQSLGRFAMTVEGGNNDLRARCARVGDLRAQSLPTLPGTIGEELATNPFLRTQSAELRQHLKMTEAASPVEVFAELRRRKDEF